MRPWTVNNVPLADLGIDNLVLHLQNQDDDYVELRFPRNYDAALPDGFDVDAPVVVRYGPRVVFRGEISGPLHSASPFAEYRSLFAFGPWHRFRSMPFLYLYPYVTGDALSTHGVLGGDANDLLTAILTTNTEDIVQIGTINVGTLTVPEQEIYDQTLAQTLQSILRFVPGAQVVFDYQTDPPTIHILADNSETLTTVTLDPNDGSVSNLRAAPLYSRLVDGVTLQYEANGAIEDGTLALYQSGSGTDINTISSPNSSSGFFILGTDSAGDAASRRHFRRTILLSGAYDVSKYILLGQLWPYKAQTTGRPFVFEDLAIGEPGSTTLNLLSMIDRSMFARMFPGNATNFIISYSGKTTWPLAGIGQMDIAPTPPSPGYRPLMLRGAAYSTIPSPITYAFGSWWADDIPSQFLQTSPGDGGILRTRSTFNWTNFSNGSGNTGSYEVDPGFVNFIDPSTVGAVNSTTGQFMFVRTIDNSSMDLPEPGIAAQILAANSRLLWEGGATVRRYDAPLLFLGLARRLHISTLEADTVIQRTTIDSATGQVDLTFGAPTHLGPQDLLALYRAARAT